MGVILLISSFLKNILFWYFDAREYEHDDVFSQNKQDQVAKLPDLANKQ